MPNSKNSLRNAYLQIHLCVFLWGFTAILGKLILLSGIVLVWWRLFITVICFLLLPQIRKNIVTLSPKKAIELLAIGCVIALSWVSFFISIKVSNASVALSCLATIPFITAILDPIFLGTPFNYKEIILGIVIIPSMYLVFGFVPTTFYFGIVLGLVSAFAAAIFPTLNGIVLKNTTITPLTASFIALSGGFLGLSLILPFYLYFTNSPFMPVTTDWFWLIIMALLCTMLGFVLWLNSLQHLSAFTANLITSLEPVYGIIMAWLFFAEDKELNPNFYYGMALMLLVVMIHPFLKAKYQHS
jgi:drug/metabolite transporter (DMT)-like permease